MIVERTVWPWGGAFWIMGILRGGLVLSLRRLLFLDELVYLGWLEKTAIIEDGELPGSGQQDHSCVRKRAEPLASSQRGGKMVEEFQRTGPALDGCGIDVANASQRRNGTGDILIDWRSTLLSPWRRKWAELCLPGSLTPRKTSGAMTNGE